jgi:aryl-alcohol dehydrogenase-like predicted oxidoreductase
MFVRYNGDMTTTITRRRLGQLETSALGLGCMGISSAYGGQVQVATKWGFKFDASVQRIGVDGSPANAKRALEGSLKRLGVDHVDLWYRLP